MATTTTAETAWSAGELYRRLEGEDPFFVLDVRAEDDYEAWKIEGRGRVPTLNVPYYEMLDAGEHDDVTEMTCRVLRRARALGLRAHVGGRVTPATLAQVLAHEEPDGFHTRFFGFEFDRDAAAAEV